MDKFFLLLLTSVFTFFGCVDADEIKYYSQCGQDKYIHENIFKGKENGVFVDIGSHNGITISNSYFFEKHLNWKGVCVEPIPEVFDELKQNRTCKCIQGCISNEEGQLHF